MSQAKPSVVTWERFKSGKTFWEYLDSGIRNRELFLENYEKTVLTEEQVAALKELASRPNGPHHILVIGEEWCPDVYRGAGVAQRIAEAIGAELRFFERDQNKDIMQEYLNQGQFESIPVFVFYDKEHREICHFIERPQIANEQIHEVRKVIGDTSPEALAAQLGREPTEEEVREARARARERYLEWQRTSPLWASWRVATVDECIALLRANL